jgi:hypothetical protein
VRPHTLVLPIVAVWAAVLVISRDMNRAPPLWLAGIMTIWVNMHGSALAGLGLVPVLAVEAVLGAAHSDRWRIARQWSVFAGAAFLAALINPYGFEALTFSPYD